MTDKLNFSPPDRQPTLRVTPLPNDANPKGDIFGGWLMSQIDLAGAIAATEPAKGPVSTVAVKSLQFINPLFAHDIVSFYTKVMHVGRSSVTIATEVYAHKRMDIQSSIVKVADAEFVYVAVDGPGIKRLIPK